MLPGQKEQVWGGAASGVWAFLPCLSCRPVDSPLDLTGAAWCAVPAYSIDLITAVLGAL